VRTLLSSPDNAFRPGLSQKFGLKPNSRTYITLGIISRVLRLEVSLNNIYITDHFQTTFAERGRGGDKNPLVDVIVNIKEENSYRLLSQLRPRIRPL
jgi:hypothetical protein